MNFNLGFGPMSREIIDIICDYTVNNKKPLMIIASRNQVDAESGYVMTTPELAAQLKTKDTSYVMLCRDHCGPYFLDSEKNLSLKQAVEATKKTIAYDIEQGFDLIHIDTSRVDDTYQIAEELINFCLSLNPSIKFEFGTEENIGVAAGAVKYKQDVAFAKNFPNMKFVVAQTGSLCFEDTQAGTFEFDVVKQLVDLANANNVGLKEHNADYLTAEQVQLRKQAGVHALNIAPQLGVIQTQLSQRLLAEYKLDRYWDEYADVVLASNKWAKWTKSDDPKQKVLVAGHYCFKHPKYTTIKDVINERTDFSRQLYQEIARVFDTYTDNL